MANIIYGSVLAKERNQQIKIKVDALINANKRVPKLSVIIVGNNPASMSYVKGKVKACDLVGFKSKVIPLAEDVSEAELIATIHQENLDSTTDGILVQLPLPPHINKSNVIAAIAVEKDVDGFHPYNVGKLYAGQDTFVPCTPLGIMTMIQSTGYQIQGKNAVVIGRSQLVGLPIAYLLTQENATVTLCHSKTVNLPAICQCADIVVAAIGVAHFVKKDWIKAGAFVVDVGINRLSDGKLTGDVDFEGVETVAGYITPVPKGVGPMTIHSLLSNTYQAYLQREDTHAL